MLLLYKSGMIKVTQKFRIGVVAATGGIMLFYMAQMLLGFFHISFFGSVYGSGLIGIGFSLFVVAIAALNLVLDFDFVEQGVAYGVPKYMEWYARIRHHGDAGVAVPGDAAAAVEDAQPLAEWQFTIDCFLFPGALSLVAPASPPAVVWASSPASASPSFTSPAARSV